MWPYAIVFSMAVAAGVFSLPDRFHHDRSTIMEARAEAYAMNLARFQRAAVNYAYRNPSHHGAINYEMLQLPQTFRLNGPWAATRHMNGDVAAWINGSIDVPVAMVAERLTKLTEGKYGVGIVRGNTVLGTDSNSKTVTLSEPLPEGAVAYVSPVSP